MYGSLMNVATLQPYPQALFPALQCCTLKSLLFSVEHCYLRWEEGLQGDKTMNLAVMCGDFQTIFINFQLSVLILVKH